MQSRLYAMLKCPIIAQLISSLDKWKRLWCRWWLMSVKLWEMRELAGVICSSVKKSVQVSKWDKAGFQGKRKVNSIVLMRKTSFTVFKTHTKTCRHGPGRVRFCSRLSFTCVKIISSKKVSIYCCWPGAYAWSRRVRKGKTGINGFKGVLLKRNFDNEWLLI